MYDSSVKKFADALKVSDRMYRNPILESDSFVDLSLYKIAAMQENLWKSSYDMVGHCELAPYEYSCRDKISWEMTHNIMDFIVPSNVQSILDVGSGIGDITAKLATKHSRVTGVDYSLSLLNRAHKEYPQIPFMCASAESLPFKDNSFDMTTCIGVLQCAFNYDTILNELARVSTQYILLSTLYRSNPSSNPKLTNKFNLKKMYATKYHPSELIDILLKSRFKPIKSVYVDESGTITNHPKTDNEFFMLFKNTKKKN